MIFIVIDFSFRYFILIYFESFIFEDNFSILYYRLLLECLQSVKSNLLRSSGSLLEVENFFLLVKVLK